MKEPGSFDPDSLDFGLAPAQPPFAAAFFFVAVFLAVFLAAFLRVAFFAAVLSAAFLTAFLTAFFVVAFLTAFFFVAFLAGGTGTTFLRKRSLKGSFELRFHSVHDGRVSCPTRVGAVGATS